MGKFREIAGKGLSWAWDKGVASPTRRVAEGFKRSKESIGQRPLVLGLRRRFGNVFGPPADFTRGAASQTAEVVDDTVIEPAKIIATSTLRSQLGVAFGVPWAWISGWFNAGRMALSPFGRLAQGVWRTGGHYAGMAALALTLRMGKAKEKLISAPRATLEHLIQHPRPKLKNAPRLAQEITKPVTELIKYEWQFAQGIGHALQSVGQGVAGVLDIPSAGMTQVNVGKARREAKWKAPAQPQPPSSAQAPPNRPATNNASPQPPANNSSQPAGNDSN